MASDERRDFYPEIEPYATEQFAVDDRHALYLEQSGDPDGKPVVVLHGGPGGGADPDLRRFFDPDAYRIVVFSQRGCGGSTPHADLVDNTTRHLVDDVERIREHLGIERWQVFGGSWGSTLSLLYAAAHPDRVTELVVRGIFLMTRRELLWFFQSGASEIWPEAWEGFVEPIPEVERGDLISAYHRRLTSDDAETRRRAALAWARWEASTSHLFQSDDDLEKASDEAFAEAIARIENHFFVHGGFLDSEDRVLRGVEKFRDKPGVIVQGRYDIVCPVRSAFELARAWPASELVIVDDAGHSATEPGIRAALIEATDRFAR